MREVTPQLYKILMLLDINLLIKIHLKYKIKIRIKIPKCLMHLKNKQQNQKIVNKISKWISLNTIKKKFISLLTIKNNILQKSMND